MSATRRRMNARMMISLSSESVCTNARSCSRSTSMASVASTARPRASDGRPDSMFTSPVNAPGPCTTIGRSPPAAVGCTASMCPVVITRKCATGLPASYTMSPAGIRRTRPRAATRAICAGVRMGNAGSGIAAIALSCLCQRQGESVGNPLLACAEDRAYLCSDDRRRVVLIGAFSPDGLGVCKCDVDARRRHAHALPRQAHKMHFDARRVGVPHRAMCEMLESEIGGQLTVDAHQQVAIERRGDAERAVVREKQLRLGFHETCAEEQPAAWRQAARGFLEGRIRLGP